MHGFKPENSESHTTSNSTYHRYMDKVQDQHQNGFDIRDPFAARLMQMNNAKEAREAVVRMRQDIIQDVKQQVNDKRQDIQRYNKHALQMSERQRNRLEDEIYSPFELKDPTVDLQRSQKQSANIARKYNPYGNKGF